MVVDDCKSATIEEEEYDQTFDEDRAACQIERTTPGENKFINVNTPLQLGGRSNPNIDFPMDVTDVHFDGCIKNLIHDGQVSGAFTSLLYHQNQFIFYQLKLCNSLFS